MSKMTKCGIEFDQNDFDQNDQSESPLSWYLLVSQCDGSCATWSLKTKKFFKNTTHYIKMCLPAHFFRLFMGKKEGKVM